MCSLHVLNNFKPCRCSESRIRSNSHWSMPQPTSAGKTSAELEKSLPLAKDCLHSFEAVQFKQVHFRSFQCEVLKMATEKLSNCRTARLLSTMSTFVCSQNAMLLLVIVTTGFWNCLPISAGSIGQYTLTWTIQYSVIVDSCLSLALKCSTTQFCILHKITRNNTAVKRCNELVANDASDCMPFE